MKKFKINYLLIDIITLLLAVALWTSVPWFGKADNRIAAIQARGEFRVSTILTPLTYTAVNGKNYGLDYELVQQFADYLGVQFKITVRQNISQFFDDLDHDNADMLAAGLIYNNECIIGLPDQTRPLYYSVSQQLVYRIGGYRPCTLAEVNESQLTIAQGHVALDDLRELKEKKYPDLSWKVDEKHGTTALFKQVVDGKLNYTVADSAAINLFQRVYSELVVALNIFDEQPITWFRKRDDDNTPSAAMLDFFNTINGAGIFARLEEKYLGMETGLTMLMLTLLIAFCLSYSRCLRSMPSRLTGGYWRRSLTTSRTGIRKPPRRPARAICRIMISKVPDSVPQDEKIWYALAAYNMGYAHMLNAPVLTVKTKGNPE